MYTNNRDDTKQPHCWVVLRSSRRSALISILLLLGLIVFPVLAEEYYEATVDDADGGDDDNCIDLSGDDMDIMHLMPVSCVNYMNGNMIKYEMFTNDNNRKHHSDIRATFVVSISHYMHVYFNYQSRLQCAKFRLLSDAGYLNCILLQQIAYSDQKLYAKIGCLERKIGTSTKLRIHVYTDKQYSIDYKDSQSENQRTSHV